MADAESRCSKGSQYGLTAYKEWIGEQLTLIGLVLRMYALVL